MEILVLDSPLNNTHYLLGYLHSIRHRLYTINEYVGCGSSVVVVLLLNMGLSPAEINTLLLRTHIFDCHGPRSDTGDDYIGHILKDLVESYCGFVPTLSQLQSISGKTLRLACLVNGALDYLSADSHPELCCVSACCMAYNYPGRYFNRTYCGSTITDCSYQIPLPLPLPHRPTLVVYTCISPTRLSSSEVRNTEVYYSYLLQLALSTQKDMVANNLEGCEVLRLVVDHQFTDLNYLEKARSAHRGAGI
jgi:hypothetical protein